MEAAEGFAEMTPAMKPLFLNLPAIDPGKLESEGGFFGWVLQLVQQRRARPAEFKNLLRRATDHLESMSAEQRLRWLELLSYVLALVYHERNESEQPELQDRIEASVRTDEDRQEFFAMRRTYAQTLKEEGMVQGELRARRQMLLHLLRKKFGVVPQEIADTIETSNDIERLYEWLDQFVTANTLDEVGIPKS